MIIGLSRRSSILLIIAGQSELYTEVDPILQLSDSEILPSESVSQPQSLNLIIAGRQLVRRAQKNHGFGNISPVRKHSASGLTTAPKRGNLWIGSSNVQLLTTVLEWNVIGVRPIPRGNPLPPTLYAI
ncbi:hypothetical protein V1507DRAFT_469571 [Lipomyces tetrasporus]